MNDDDYAPADDLSRWIATDEALAEAWLDGNLAETEGEE